MARGAPFQSTIAPVIVGLALFTVTFTLAMPGTGQSHALDDPATEMLHTPASHNSQAVPEVAEGFLVQHLAPATVPTAVTFHDGESPLEAVPGTEETTQDLYYTDLAGNVNHLDLLWSPVGPVVVGQETLAEGFTQPLGLTFGEDGTLYVSDSYTHETADRPVGIVYAVDPDTGDREAIVDGVPAGQHHINQIEFGPDDRLYLPVGNPNDSGNGTGTGHTDIFPYSGAFLSVDVDEVRGDPAVLHWEDEDGNPIPDDDIVDHDRNQDFAEKVDVFAFGFRNIYGVTWAPDHLPFAGEMYTGTNGGDTPASQDTFYKVQEDTHHGYPFCASQGDPGATDGIVKEAWEGSPHEDFNCDRSPPAQALLGWHVCATGLDIPTLAEPGYPDFTFPDEMRSSAFVGECAVFSADSWLEKNLEHPSTHNTAHQVTRVALDEDGEATDVREFIEGLALPTDVEFGPDGAMYIADAEKLLRVAPTMASGTETPLSTVNAPVQTAGATFLPQITIVPTGVPVEWNGGALLHTVTTSDQLCTPGDNEACQPNADEEDENTFSEALPSGGTVTHAFTEAGVYPYYCIPHQQLGMTGMVIAVDPADPTAVGPEDVQEALGAQASNQQAGLSTHAGHSHSHAHAHPAVAS